MFQSTKLGVVGGKDGPTTTRRVLNAFISQKLATKLNWTGRNEKGGFKEFNNIIKLVIGII